MSLIEWIVNNWNFMGPILTTIIPTMVTLFAAFTFSERAVERSRLKRLHSEKLQSSLKTWMEYLDRYTFIDTEYRPLENDFIPKTVASVEEISFYRFLIEHLEKGHKNFYNEWNDCIDFFKNLNQLRANIFQDIYQKILDQL